MKIVVQKYISLLRGINVSGQKKIKMEQLKTFYESLHFQNVKTYIQSGNVIFEYPDSDRSELENRIKEIIKKEFLFSVSVIIRTKNEIHGVINNNPFSGDVRDTKNLYVTFLAETPSAETLRTIDQRSNGADKYVITGKEIYLFCHNGYGRTKFTNNYFEQKLSISATTRNWKTVNKLYELA